MCEKLRLPAISMLCMLSLCFCLLVFMTPTEVEASDLEAYNIEQLLFMREKILETENLFQPVPASTPATILTVTSGLDPDNSNAYTLTTNPDGLQTLRRAVIQARSSTKPVEIRFNIPTTCPSYNSTLQIWKITFFGTSTDPATLRYLNGQITIDGSTQPGGRTSGPKIILYGHSTTGASDGIKLGGTATENLNIIRGLGFQNFKDHLTINSESNVVENCWFGLNDEGTAPLLRNNNPASGSGVAGVALSASAKNNNIRYNNFLGLNGTAATLRGWDNIFYQNYVGTKADGTVSNPGCSPDSWLGGGGVVVQGRRQLVEWNLFAGLRFDQFDISQPPDALRVTTDDIAGAGHTIRFNLIGWDLSNTAVGSCGRGIYLSNHLRGTILESNYIANTSLPGMSLNGLLYNQCELSKNVIYQTFIEYGPALPDAFKNYKPAKVTKILGGKIVQGTSGDGSPGPNCWIELFLDTTDSPVESRVYLVRVQADSNGNWEATIPDFYAPIAVGDGIRTTTTSTAANIIGSTLAGTTTGLSERYIYLGSFTDVPPGHPFFEEIEALAASGITTGFPDGTFRPSGPVTRQAMAAFLVRAFDLKISGGLPSTPTFSDVPTNHPFFAEIETLAASGITTGFPDGTFRPSANVTRQAMAAFLFRALGLANPGVAIPTFSDVPTTHPFFIEIEALAKTGVTTGWPDGTFRPGLDVTRQAMAAFLIRALEL